MELVCDIDLRQATLSCDNAVTLSQKNDSTTILGHLFLSRGSGYHAHHKYNIESIQVCDKPSDKHMTVVRQIWKAAFHRDRRSCLAIKLR